MSYKVGDRVMVDYSPYPKYADAWTGPGTVTRAYSGIYYDVYDVQKDGTGEVGMFKAESLSPLDAPIFNPGDLVKFTRGEESVTGRIQTASSGRHVIFLLPYIAAGIDEMIEYGYTWELISKAEKPLPTHDYAMIRWDDGSALPQIARRGSKDGIFPLFPHEDWFTYLDGEYQWITDENMRTLLKGREWSELVAKEES